MEYIEHIMQRIRIKHRFRNTVLKTYTNIVRHRQKYTEKHLIIQTRKCCTKTNINSQKQAQASHRHTNTVTHASTEIDNTGVQTHFLDSMRTTKETGD